VFGLHNAKIIATEWGEREGHYCNCDICWSDTSLPVKHEIYCLRAWTQRHESVYKVGEVSWQLFTLEYNIADSYSTSHFLLCLWEGGTNPRPLHDNYDALKRPYCVESWTIALYNEAVSVRSVCNKRFGYKQLKWK
jgi:hypothetical protein